MKALVIAAAIFFSLALMSRIEGQTDQPFDPALLDSVVGLTERDVVSMRIELVELQLELKSMEADAATAPDPHKTRLQMKEKLDTARETLASRLTPEQLSSIANLPSDPVRRALRIRKRVLEAPSLTSSQRGALTRLLELAEKLPEDEYTRARFWLLTSLVLTPDQMIYVKERLPFAYQTQPRPDNFFDLPELTPTQANRVLSAFTNLEAETTAGRVRVQTIQKQVEESSDDKSRLAAMREMLGIRAEMCDLRESAARELQDHFSAEQLKYYHAAPPFGSLGQQKNLVEWLVEPENQNAEQLERSMSRLRQLHEDWRVIEMAVKEKSKDMPEPQSPGGMAAMAELRNQVRPLENRRLVIARDIAPLLDSAKMEAYLQKGTNK